MSKLRISSLKVKNYRSFGEEQSFVFPNSDYKKPVAIVWYNNAWKSNLMNIIRYWLYERLTEDNIDLNDFHDCKWENTPSFSINYSETFPRRGLASMIQVELDNYIEVISENQKISKIIDECYRWWIGHQKADNNKWTLKQSNLIFYINFHKIKDEISTQKWSWWNLKSFLAKHIKKIVDNDDIMKSKKEDFESETRASTNKVLESSNLSQFIEDIKRNYSINLRNNACEVDFWFPTYENIFLQMMFRIWLNGNIANLVPIDHFGDWYISMFVMAVIQAIAENESEDECIFLFEEPESFLHENHQEYFYKMVLCRLAEKHQVIYTTHSDKMVDIFDTKSLIRLEMEEIESEIEWWEKTLQTVNKYNEIWEFNPNIDISEEIEEPITLERYNEYIKTIEPNLNKILFSRKVILVEWPNDVMVYKKVLENKIKNLWKDERFAETYLSFHNIAIIPHYWKITALLLVKLCKFIKLDYFLINDWDSEDYYDLSIFQSERELKNSEIYNAQWNSTGKWKLTTNWKLINSAWINNIHFNVSKLEEVIWYESDDKNSIEIWNIINDKMFDSDLFPTSLEKFLELDKIIIESI